MASAPSLIIVLPSAKAADIGAVPNTPDGVNGALASWLSTLPTDAPATALTWWNNDGIPTRTPAA